MYTYTIPMPNIVFYTVNVSGGFKSMVAEVLAALCGHCGISINALSSKSRHRQITYARWAFWKVMISYGFSQHEVGLLLPGRAFNHTSVGNALSKLETDIKHNEIAKDTYNSIIIFDRNPYNVS